MADLIGCIRKIVTEELESTEQRMKEEFESGKKRIWTRIEGIFRDGNQTSVQRNMKLQFKNRISQKILTGEEIKGEDKNPLEIALVDESTGNIVEGGPESSAAVEILLLKGVSNASEGGDWTVEQFNENIVREAKEPLFAENKLVKLENGIGFLKNIKFRHHVKPSEFRLGARVVKTFRGVHIKEAKTESFVVKNFRNKYNDKHEIPSLSDKVSRLVNIGKGIKKRLQDHKICTVEDFRIRLLTDSEGLKKIVKLGEKKWKLIVENALACPSDTRMYCYTNEQRTTCIVFNLLGQILGLYTEKQYTSTNMLPEKHKADAEKLLESAYKHWEKVESFDDESSLQQYLNVLDCPVGGREDVGTGAYDVEIDESMQFSALDLDNGFPDIDEFLNDNWATQLDGLINELNAGEFVESMNVQINRKPPNAWGKLFCVLKWLLIIKRVSVDSIRRRKKQKLG